MVMAGGNATIVKVAEAVLPLPKFDVTAVVLLFMTPGAIPTTFTLNVQDAPSASVAPVRLTVPEPAVAVMEPPPQVPLKPLGVATKRPAGRLSVKPTPLTGTAVFRFVIVKLRLVLPLSGTVAAPNVLLIVGGTPPVG